MYKNKLRELLKMSRDCGVIVSFSGQFSQGIIAELGNAVRRHVEDQAVSKTEIHNVFAIFIEQTQNIQNYTTSKQGTTYYINFVNSGIVTIGRDAEGYHICSGNVVSNVDLSALQEKLDAIILLSKEAIKDVYRKQMKAELPPDAIGAGLGFLDMARKASRPLEYDIQEIDDEYSFFSLNAVV